MYCIFKGGDFMAKTIKYLEGITFNGSPIGFATEVPDEPELRNENVKVVMHGSMMLLVQYSPDKEKEARDYYRRVYERDETAEFHEFGVNPKFIDDGWKTDDWDRKEGFSIWVEYNTRDALNG